MTTKVTMKEVTIASKLSFAAIRRMYVDIMLFILHVLENVKARKSFNKFSVIRLHR